MHLNNAAPAVKTSPPIAHNTFSETPTCSAQSFSMSRSEVLFWALLSFFLEEPLFSPIELAGSPLPS